MKDIESSAQASLGAQTQTQASSGTQTQPQPDVSPQITVREVENWIYCHTPEVKHDSSDSVNEYNGKLLKQLKNANYLDQLASGFAKEKQLDHGQALEFPTKSGYGVKVYTVCSYSAGDTYPREECRRLVL